MHKLPLTDAFFLLMESSRLPMHVAGLSVFSLPPGVDSHSFLQELRDRICTVEEYRNPFNVRVKSSLLGDAGGMHWSADRGVDMEYHVRQSTLRTPRCRESLFERVSSLHEQVLDRSRPLWELHLIEGLKDRQFAAYFKVHHAAVDGVGAMHLISSMYARHHRTRIKESPFSKQAHESYKRRLQEKRQEVVRPTEQEARTVSEILREQLGTTVSVSGAVQEWAKVLLGGQCDITMPYKDVPRSPLNQRLTGAREFVGGSWSLERIRQCGKAYDGTINDVVMAMCAGALRHYLQDIKELPSKSLTAMAPVSFRSSQDVESSNAVGMVCVELGTDEADAARRMKRIQASMGYAKSQLQSMTAREVILYNSITHAPMVLSLIAGKGEKLPAWNTVISNVPGPQEQLYWNGAKLQALYPVSMVVDGIGLNFTVGSNHNNLDFGILSCPDLVPGVQCLVDYAEESLSELEEAAGISHMRRQKR